MKTQELLYRLAIQANNVIMKGRYTGDEMIEAVSTMELCHKIVKAIDEQKTEQNPERGSGDSKK